MALKDIRKKSVPTALIITAIITLAIFGYSIWKIAGKIKHAGDQDQTNSIELKNESPEHFNDDFTQNASLDLSAATDESTEAMSDISKIAAGHLDAGAELEYLPQSGDFGAWNDAILMFYKAQGCVQCEFYGKVLAPKTAGYKEIAFPAFHQFDNETVDNIGIVSVMFTNIDFDRENEIIILTEGYKKGPSGWSIYNTAVLDWQKTEFKPITKLENYFGEHCQDADCVKQLLETYFNFVNTYTIDNENITADLIIALTDQGELTGRWDAVYGAGHTCEVNALIEPSSPNTASVAINDKQIAELAIESGKANLNFLTDMSQFDCGSEHPDEVSLRKK
ncbi:MAG TPA: hypothetical protein VMX18_00070 [Candidatus Bipolaricaulota bacterium]|nr:hypothetical protein [Candidatus Bipolaricaulota bacterium]